MHHLVSKESFSHKATVLPDHLPTKQHGSLHRRNFRRVFLEWIDCKFVSLHWKPRSVIMATLSSLTAPQPAVSPVTTKLSLWQISVFSIYREYRSVAILVMNQHRLNRRIGLKYTCRWLTVVQTKNKSVHPGIKALQWRHNGCDGVSNHKLHNFLPIRLFRRRSKKTAKLRVTGLCARNSPVNSPHKGPVSRKMFPFDDVIILTVVQTKDKSVHPGIKCTWYCGIIGSYCDLMPVQPRDIIWNNAVVLSIGSIGTIFSEMWTKIERYV